MNNNLLRISDLACAVGRQPETIRRWEREGRIPPARPEVVTNHRVWTVEEAQLIERMLEGTLIKQADRLLLPAPSSEQEDTQP